MFSSLKESKMTFHFLCSLLQKAKNKINLIYYSHFLSSNCIHCKHKNTKKMNFASENLINSVEKNLKESNMKFQDFGVASRPAHINKSESAQIKTQDIESDHNNQDETDQYEYDYHPENKQNESIQNNKQNQPPLPLNYHPVMFTPQQIYNSQAVGADQSFKNYYPPFYPPMYNFQNAMNLQNEKKKEDQKSTNNQQNMDIADQNRMNMAKKVLEEKIKNKTKKQNKSKSKSSMSSQSMFDKALNESKGKQSKNHNFIKKYSKRLNPFSKEISVLALIIILVAIILIAILAFFALDSIFKLRSIESNGKDSSVEDSFCPQNTSIEPIIKNTIPQTKITDNQPNQQQFYQQQINRIPNNQQQINEQQPNQQQFQQNSSQSNDNMNSQELQKNHVRFSPQPECPPMETSHVSTLKQNTNQMQQIAPNGSESYDSFVN